MTEAGDDKGWNDGKGESGVFEKSTRAVPGEAAERDFCLCVSSVGC